jgi:hypothetical protein
MTKENNDNSYFYRVRGVVHSLSPGPGFCSLAIDDIFATDVQVALRKRLL